MSAADSVETLSNKSILSYIKNTDINRSNHIGLMECIWAVDYLEVQRACFLARVCSSLPPKCCRFWKIAAIIQKGPTCGLTALSMLLAGKPSPEELLIIAKESGYTLNGEMFCAKNFYQLISKIIVEHKEPEDEKEGKIQCRLHEGRLNCAKVKESLKNGACIFVPYPFLNSF